MQATQAMALVALVAIAAVAAELDASGYLVWGVLGGLAGTVALGSFYAALASGTMGVVAPIAATGAVVPVVIGLAGGESPTPFQLVGIVVAVAGVILASGPERNRDAAAGGRALRPLLLAAVAAVGFGLTLVVVARGAEHSVVMTLATMRAVNALVCTVLLTLALRRAGRPTRRDLPALALIAGTDAAANGAYAVATHTALVSVSAVLASLYPAVTALLAWRFQGEHLRPIQVVGVVATLSGVALMAGGG